MLMNYTAVIQAGGKGTRLSALTDNKIPKPLVEINGKPMLEWQIENLIRYGITDIVIIIGYLGDKIQEHLGSGEKWYIKITYIKEEEPLGSAGALFYLKGRQKKDFLLVFGDVMFDIDWNRFIVFHENSGGMATLLVHPNSHPYDSDIIVMDKENRVRSFLYKSDDKSDYYDNCVNSGLYIFKSDVLEFFEEKKFLDLEKDVLLELAIKGKVYGYKSSEYVKDAGTLERIKNVSEEQKKGIWQSRNLENKQRCIFLDRDGTLNKFKGFISVPEEFELEDNVVKAVKMINESGYLAIVVTNQPVVARGLCNMETVEKMHRKLSVLLGENGAYLDDIVFCPHHPDKGFEGENVIYKVSCNCRKPATGMIDGMVQKYNIDIKQSYIIGDSTVDIQTGINAGIKTILLHTGQAGRDGKYDVKPDMEAEDLVQAVAMISKM